MPPISIVPEVGVSRPTRQRPSVVFPDPDSPTRPTLSPRPTSIETPRERVDLIAGPADEHLAEILDAQQRSDDAGARRPPRAASSTARPRAVPRASPTRISPIRTQAVTRFPSITSSGGLPARHDVGCPPATRLRSCTGRQPRPGPGRSLRSRRARVRRSVGRLGEQQPERVRVERLVLDASATPTSTSDPA